MTRRLAWLGVGHLARYCVPPLVARFGAGAMTLSPRGADAAAALATEQGIAIAPDNATLIEGADVVFLAPRPAVAVAAATGLPWRRDQVVISLCAGLPLATLAPAVAPAQLCRAMPVLAARWGECPSVLYPAPPVAQEILAAWGPVVAVTDEEQYETAATPAVFYSWLMRLQADLAASLVAGGLPAGQARLLTAQMFRAVGTVGREDLAQNLTEIWQELCSPGSFSRRGLELLEAANALQPWPAAAERIMEFLRAKA